MSSFSTNLPNFTVPNTLTESEFPPEVTQGVKGYSASNSILGGRNNKIEDSRNCSVLNGISNLISGRYNTHVIGNFVVPEEDNSLVVGCLNGMKVHGDIQSTYNIISSGRMICNSNLEIGPGHVNFAYIDLKNNVSEDADIRIAQGVGSSQSEYDLYIGPAPNSPQACNLHVEGDVVSYYASDKRLKDDITLIDEPLSKVMSLDAIEFNWNDNQSTYTGHDIGLVAQQVEQVAPEIVETRKDGYKAIKYEKVNALLVGAIQEQQKKIEFLEKRLESLERRSSHS